MRTWHLKELAYKVLRNGSRMHLDLNLMPGVGHWATYFTEP